jgi:rhodanese-related sulfurtransferase
VFWAGRGPCYRCLYPEPPPPGVVPSCAEGGVLGVLPGIVGSIQAAEALKLVLGVGEPLLGRLLLIDALDMRFRELTLRRDPQCPSCGDRPTLRTLSTLRPEAVACETPDPVEIDATELRDRLDRGEPLALVDVRSPQEWAIARLPGATLIPLPSLAARLDELPPDTPIVFYCHHGTRSRQAVDLLRLQGRRARSLRGGADAWARTVDPAMVRY